MFIQGYTHRFERQVVCAAQALGMRAVMRGEFADIRRRSLVKNAVRNVYLDWFYRHVNTFCYIGETARRHLECRGIRDDKLFFSPYSVDTELFEQQATSSSRLESRKKLGLNDDIFVLLFSGKLIPRKEPLLLLEAIRRLPRRDQVALIVVGDGPLREQVLAQGKMVLGDRLLAPGFVNQSGLGAYFAAADAHVMASNHETWGLVVNEAMYFGLPSVVSDRVGCHLDLVKPQKTGLVFKSGDACDLSSQINTLLENPQDAKAMGENASALVREYSIARARDGILMALGLGSSR